MPALPPNSTTFPELLRRHNLPPNSVTLIPPSPPESTEAFLILLHGLGDSEASFVQMSRAMQLPRIACIAVRGCEVLPASLLYPSGNDDDDDVMRDSGGRDGKVEHEAVGRSRGHYHYGDDLRFDGDRIDPDPGFTRAIDMILDRLICGVLVAELGWRTADVMVLGFGQGGSLALGLAAHLAWGNLVTRPAAGRTERNTDENAVTAAGNQKEVTNNTNTNTSTSTSTNNNSNDCLLGVVTIGGPMPWSCVGDRHNKNRRKCATPLLACRRRYGSALSHEAVDDIKDEFENVQVVTWPGTGDSMPQNREEMYPLMAFFADGLKRSSVVMG